MVCMARRVHWWVAAMVYVLLLIPTCGQTQTQKDTYSESLVVTPVQRDLVHVLVDMRVTADLGTHYNYFPKKFAQLAHFSKLEEMHLSIARGVWVAGWGAQPSPAPAAMQLRASFGSTDKVRSWAALSQTLAAYASASLGFCQVDAQPEYARAFTLRNVTRSGGSTAPWDFVSFIPAEESLCTENLTPILGLLPHRGATGLASLLEPTRFFATRYHSVHLTYRRENGAYTLRVVADSVAPTGVGGAFSVEVPRDCDLCSTPVLVSVVIRPGFEELLEVMDTERAEVTTGSVTTVDFNSDATAVQWGAVEPSWQPALQHANTSVASHAADDGDDMGTLYVHTSVGGATHIRILVPLPLLFLQPHVSTLRVQWDGGEWEEVPLVVTKALNMLAVQVDQEAKGQVCVLKLRYDKNILTIAQYPPDANRLYLLPPVVVWGTYPGGVQEAVSPAPAGVLLPSPDFSMPFNILTLSCTALALVFGAVFSHVTKDFATN